jgi:hypothetical protein
MPLELKVLDVEKYMSPNQQMQFHFGPKSVQNGRKKNSALYVPDPTGGINGKFYNGCLMSIIGNTAGTLKAHILEPINGDIYVKQALLNNTFTLREANTVTFFPISSTAGTLDPVKPVKYSKKFPENVPITCNANSFSVTPNFPLGTNSYCALQVDTKDVNIFEIEFDATKFSLTPTLETFIGNGGSITTPGANNGPL